MSLHRLVCLHARPKRFFHVFCSSQSERLGNGGLLARFCFSTSPRQSQWFKASSSPLTWLALNLDGLSCDKKRHHCTASCALRTLAKSVRKSSCWCPRPIALYSLKTWWSSGSTMAKPGRSERHCPSTKSSFCSSTSSFLRLESCPIPHPRKKERKRAWATLDASSGALQELLCSSSGRLIVISLCLLLTHKASKK